MSFQLPNTRPVTSSKQVSFHCKHCGACCRHVRESIPMNTLDAYRLTKYLRSRGEHIDCLYTVFARYTEPVLLHESGFTVFMLSAPDPENMEAFSHYGSKLFSSNKGEAKKASNSISKPWQSSCRIRSLTES